MISDRTRLEMERGRIISQRKQRESDLGRMVAAGKVRIERRKNRQHFFYVDGLHIASQDFADDDYPGETVMATIQLAIAATVGFDGVTSEADSAISDEERAARDAYRLTLRKWE